MNFCAIQVKFQEKSSHQRWALTLPKCQTDCLFHVFPRELSWHIHSLQSLYNTFPFHNKSLFGLCRAGQSQAGIFEPEKMIHLKMNDSLQYVQWASVNGGWITLNSWNASCSSHQCLFERMSCTTSLHQSHGAAEISKSIPLEQYYQLSWRWFHPGNELLPP